MTTLPDHLFIDADGDLFDTRLPDWSRQTPVRRRFRINGALLTGDGRETLGQVKAALRAGEHTSLGGYPLYFVTRDGAALSYDAARARFGEVCYDHLNDCSTGWRIEAVAINYEDADLRCAHTDAPIPSAYGDDAADAA